MRQSSRARMAQHPARERQDGLGSTRSHANKREILLARGATCTTQHLPLLNAQKYTRGIDMSHLPTERYYIYQTDKSESVCDELKHDQPTSEPKMFFFIPTECSLFC